MTGLSAGVLAGMTDQEWSDWLARELRLERALAADSERFQPPSRVAVLPVQPIKGLAEPWGWLTVEVSLSDDVKVLKLGVLEPGTPRQLIGEIARVKAKPGRTFAQTMQSSAAAGGGAGCFVALCSSWPGWALIGSIATGVTAASGLCEVFRRDAVRRRAQGELVGLGRWEEALADRWALVAAAAGEYRAAVARAPEEIRGGATDLASIGGLTDGLRTVHQLMWRLARGDEQSPAGAAAGGLDVLDQIERLVLAETADVRRRIAPPAPPALLRPVNDSRAELHQLARDLEDSAAAADQARGDVDDITRTVLGSERDLD